MPARRGFGMLTIAQADGDEARLKKSSLPGLDPCHAQKLKKFEAVPGGKHEVVATWHGRVP